jgi:hypothetical protein
VVRFCACAIGVPTQMEQVPVSSTKLLRPNLCKPKIRPSDPTLNPTKRKFVQGKADEVENHLVTSWQYFCTLGAHYFRSEYGEQTRLCRHVVVCSDCSRLCETFCRLFGSQNLRRTSVLWQFVSSPQQPSACPVFPNFLHAERVFPLSSSS